MDKRLEQRFAQLYQSIAQQTVNMIFEEWDRVYLLGQVEKSPEYPMDAAPNPMLRTTFYYIDSKTKKSVRYTVVDEYMQEKEARDGIRKLSFTIYDLNKIFRKESGGDWGKVWDAMTFTMEKDGKFTIDYQYDSWETHRPISDKYTLDKETLWAYDTCGFKHKEGSIYRKRLDEYLRNERGEDV